MRKNFEITLEQADLLLKSLCNKIQSTANQIMTTKDFNTFKDYQDEILEYLEDAGRIIEYKEDF